MERKQQHYSTQDLSDLERKHIEEEFYHALEESDTLVDYFCLVGLDQQRILQIVKEKLSREQSLEELRALKPHLICRFPPKNKKGLKIEEGVELEIHNYAFPLGYKIIQANEPPPPKSIPMMFDGGLQKIFAQFLIVYEDLEDYRQAHDNFMIESNKAKGLVPNVNQNDRDTRVSNMTQNSRDSMNQGELNGDVVRSTTIFNDIPIHQRGVDNFEEEKKHQSSLSLNLSPQASGVRDTMGSMKQGGHYQLNHQQSASPTSSMTSKHPNRLTPQQIGGLSLSKTNSQNILDTSHRSLLSQNVTGSIFGTNAAQNRMSMAQGRIYIPKALCIMSRYPFYDYFKEILEDLYHATKHHTINVLEAYINKLVLECPAPPRGLAKVKYEKFSRPGKFMEFTQPPINELPYVNHSFFNILFKALPVELIVTIFTHLLVERSILIVSPKVEILLPVVQSLINLIHPFEWVRCIPFIKREPGVELEQSQLYYVCQPFSYIIGILEEDLQDALQLLQENSESKPLIVELSKYKANQCGLGGRQRHKKLGQEQASNCYPTLETPKPTPIKTQSYTVIYFQMRTLSSNQETMGNLSASGIAQIRNSFYQVLLELFQYYKEFVIKDQDGETTFDIKRFCGISNKQYSIQSTDKNDRVANELFHNFISQQQVNNYNNIQCAIIHFQESIQKLQDGESIAPHKRFNAFLQDESQKFKETVDAPPVQYTSFSMQELKDSYLMNKELPQLIPMEQNFDQESTEGYRYLIFPVLNRLLYESPKIFNMDGLAVNLESKLQTNSKYRTESKQSFRSIFQLQKINIPYVSRTEGTYVYITWIYMWCATLWMQDEREKYFRLLQVLQVIAKLKAEYIQRPQLDLFFLLIEASFRYGTMKMTQKIYETLPKYDLKPDARIQSRYFQHLKINQKRQTQEKKDKKDKSNNIRKSDIQPSPQQTTNNSSSNKNQSIINDKEARMNQRDAQYLNPDSRLYRQVKYQQQFRKRTFKTQSDANILFDEVKLKLQEECGHCQGQLLATQLRKAIENLHMQSQKANGSFKCIHALCTYCGREIQAPQLKVMIGKRIKNVKGSFKEESTIFVSAAQLHKWIDILFFESEDMQIDVNTTMRESNQHVFWNLIYYFNDYLLPFDFILPYEDSKEFDLQYDEFKKNAQAVRVHQMKNDMDEVIEEEKENENEDGVFRTSSPGPTQGH